MVEIIMNRCIRSFQYLSYLAVTVAERMLRCARGHGFDSRCNFFFLDSVYGAQTAHNKSPPNGPINLTITFDNPGFESIPFHTVPADSVGFTIVSRRLLHTVKRRNPYNVNTLSVETTLNYDDSAKNFHILKNPRQYLWKKNCQPSCDARTRTISLFSMFSGSPRRV